MDSTVQIAKLTNTQIEKLHNLGLFSAAVIHEEYGDFKRFVNPSKLLAYAVLECSTIQSGTSEYRGKMVKRGSPSLRFALMNMAVSVKKHCPTFSAYYHKKFNDEHKHYRVALSHVVRKLLRVMHYMVITNTVYDSSLSN